MDLILQYLPTVLVAAAVFGAVCLTSYKIIRDKKAGKSSCSGCKGCSGGCPSARIS